MLNSITPVILCVDGEHVALQARALILSVAGYRVLTATTGEDALRVFRLNSVDLVIIDLWRPKSTVMEVVDQMKQAHPKVPVILLSGPAELPSGFERADLLLTKCITPPEFIAAVSSVIDKSLPAGANTVDVRDFEDELSTADGVREQQTNEVHRVLAEVYQLLEEYSPNWYSSDLREKLLSALESVSRYDSE